MLTLSEFLSFHKPIHKLASDLGYEKTSDTDHVATGPNKHFDEIHKNLTSTGYKVLRRSSINNGKISHYEKNNGKTRTHVSIWHEPGEQHVEAMRIHKS